MKLRYTNDHFSSYKFASGALQFTSPKDTLFAYYILEPYDTINKRIVLAGNQGLKISNINPGMYALLLVTYEYNTIQVSNIIIKAGFTTCVRASDLSFSSENNLLQKIIRDNLVEEKAFVDTITSRPQKANSASQNVIYINPAGAAVTGTITDGKGKSPVPGASIILKGFNKGVSADTAGTFIFNGLPAGRYILQIAAVGYQPKEVEINVEVTDNL